MSGVGFFELVILFMIGLVVLGPQRLPKVANQIGSWIGQARRMTRVMKRQLEDELADNAWLSGPADTAIIFETPCEQRWEAAAALIVVDLRLISGETGHA